MLQPRAAGASKLLNLGGCVEAFPIGIIHRLPVMRGGCPLPERCSGRFLCSPAVLLSLLSRVGCPFYEQRLCVQHRGSLLLSALPSLRSTSFLPSFTSSSTSIVLACTPSDNCHSLRLFAIQLSLVICCIRIPFFSFAFPNNDQAVVPILADVYCALRSYSFAN